MSAERLPKPPAEVPSMNSPSVLAPRFRDALQRVFLQMRDAGFDPVIGESLRSAERQKFLYGFGRTYDDGRGIVTHAADCDTSWHCFGLAVDVVSKQYGWDAPATFWRALRAAAEHEGLIAGASFSDPDLPHVQWGKPMRRRPSPAAAALRASGGNAAVWRVVGAA